MPIDPATASIIGSGLTGFANFLGGTSQSKIQDKQFNKQLALNVNREREKLPLRDQLMYLLSARMGYAPGQFRGRDIFNPTISSDIPQLGTSNTPEFAQTVGQYSGPRYVNKPFYDTMMKQLGYK